MTAPDRPRRTTSRRSAARAVTTALVGGSLLVSCAQSPTVTTDADVPSGSEPAPHAAAAPSGAPDAPAAGSVELPWPAPNAAEAAALQAAVDRGSQPWLLDPTEVAMAYAAAAHAWPDAEAYPGPDGTSVDVRNAEGDRLTLSMEQPARTGDDGIWVVTAER